MSTKQLSKLNIKNISVAPAILIISMSSGMAYSADTFNLKVSQSRT